MVSVYCHHQNLQLNKPGTFILWENSPACGSIYYTLSEYVLSEERKKHCLEGSKGVLAKTEGGGPKTPTPVTVIRKIGQNLNFDSGYYGMFRKITEYNQKKIRSVLPPFPLYN